MILAMMMAMDRNRLIGAKGGMPWHLPAELKYFKSVTMGKPIIMGRKTFDSIGRALPGRTNIVLTGKKDWHADSVIVAQDLSEALKQAENHLDVSGEAMIIGGAQLCREAMPCTRKLYLTVIDHAFEGDVWLDSFDEDEWLETDSRVVVADDKNPWTYNCRVLERCPGTGRNQC